MAFEEVPPGTPDRRSGLLAMCVILMVLTITATVVRVISKFIVKQYWWWDDFFALLSLPIQITLLSIILAWRNIGLGLHAEIVLGENPLYLIQGAKYLYIAIFFFDSSITFPKLSALFFYARVFRSNNRTFKIHLWVVGCLVSGWLVSAYFSTIFQCTPIEKAWNSLLPGHCIDTFGWYLATAAISVAVDFYILLLPVPMIWALKISLRRRLWLLGAFFLAYSVIVLSIGRMISTINLIPNLAKDLTWNMPLYLYWACLEGSISLISISVPNMVGLIKMLAGPRWPGLNSRSSHKKYSDPESLNQGALAGVHGKQPGNDSGFERLHSSDRSFTNPRGLEAADDKGLGNEAAISLGRIHVRTHISVSSRSVPETDIPTDTYHNHI
ncbi:uncharacterized protein F4822DRAFT_83365 [Hypoxylon trugodes]|uniref:uncharacterized protein n=1 Tax=Hypoxylon trugodes TaxID=326681 RepID=UPI002192E920|nr:uncharacterized protein F4822DRAFT_83365 [Hypoxylon trugodes]KAI1383634.1 hypothetical protein F4822DRAFT_83365 [Hypoxylon trugodes]